MCFTMNSAHFSKTLVSTLNYALFSKKVMFFPKTAVFTMNYALFFKNNSFYNELYTALFFSKTTVFTMNYALFFQKQQFLQWILTFWELFGTGRGQRRSKAEPSRAWWWPRWPRWTPSSLDMIIHVVIVPPGGC